MHQSKDPISDNYIDFDYAVNRAAARVCAEERAQAARNSQLPPMIELHRRDLAARGLLLSSSLDSYFQILPSGEHEACRGAYGAPCERRNDLSDRVSTCTARANDRSERLRARPACPGISPSSYTRQLL